MPVCLNSSLGHIGFNYPRDVTVPPPSQFKGMAIIGIMCWCTYLLPYWHTLVNLMGRGWGWAGGNPPQLASTQAHIEWCNSAQDHTGPCPIRYYLAHLPPPAPQGRAVQAIWTAQGMSHQLAPTSYTGALVVVLTAVILGRCWSYCLKTLYECNCKNYPPSPLDPTACLDVGLRSSSDNIKTFTVDLFIFGFVGHLTRDQIGSTFIHFFSSKTAELDIIELLFVVIKCFGIVIPTLWAHNLCSIGFCPTDHGGFRCNPSCM